METDRLEIIIEAEAAKASKSLDKIVSQLSQMSSILPKLNSSGLNNMSTGLKQMAKSMESMSTVKATDFNRLTKGIEKLGSINNSAIYKAGNSIRNFSNSLEGIGSVSDDAVKLGEIAKGISKLGNASVQKAVDTLPRLSIALKEFMTTLSTAPNVSENIISMTNAMANLASNGAKFGSTINGMSRAAKTLTRSNNEAAASTKAFSNTHSSGISPITSFTSQISKLVGAYFTLKYVVGGIGSAIKKSMDFIETVNLFQTSYKKIGMEAAQKLGMAWGSKSADAYAKAFIDRAQTFNDNLTSALGLDPNTTMNYQAVFAQISNSLGLTSKTVENVSESFTMLGNDIASLWNIDTKSAMEKLQSGLVGQTRPLRELGIDTTQASLQLTAYKYGIEESVSKMSQAEKVQLRWLTIMDQSSVAFGDMAKTINSPANQLRILKQQWDNLSRSIGNVFLPIVTTILPYINAVVIALRNMIDALATALGYELPDYTNSNIYTDVTGDLIDVTDATDDATKANEKYKKSLMGFDEINILSKSVSSSTGSGSASTGSGNSQLDDAINKKTASYMAKFNEQLKIMSNKSKDIADNIKEFFSNVAEKSEPTIQAFKDLWEAIKPFAKNVGGGLKWFYDNVLVPMSTMVIDETIPNVLYAMESALGLLNTVIDKFKDNKGKDTLLGFLEGLQEAKLENVSDWFKKIGDAFKELNDFIESPNLKDFFDFFKSEISVGFKLIGLPDFTDPWKVLGISEEMKIKIKAEIITTWEDLKKTWEALVKHFVGKTVYFLASIPQVWKDLKPLFHALYDKFIGKEVNFKVSVPQVWKDISTRFYNMYNKFIGKKVDFVINLLTTLGDITSFINELVSRINSEVLSKLSITVDIPFTDKDWKWHAPLIPLPFPDKHSYSSSIGKFVTGGFPEDGLFMANHSELVGQFANGKTAVANNSQITAGIEEAAYRGYMRAMAESGGGNSGQPVYIENVWRTDNETLYRETQKGKLATDRRYHAVAQPV